MTRRAGKGADASLEVRAELLEGRAAVLDVRLDTYSVNFDAVPLVLSRPGIDSGVQFRPAVVRGNRRRSGWPC